MSTELIMALGFFAAMAGVMAFIFYVPSSVERSLRKKRSNDVSEVVKQHHKTVVVIDTAGAAAQETVKVYRGGVGDRLVETLAQTAAALKPTTRI